MHSNGDSGFRETRDLGGIVPLSNQRCEDEAAQEPGVE